MIRYDLECDQGHQFDSWFRNADAFDTQKADGFLSCPFCGTGAVKKALMAPSVSTSRKKAERDNLIHQKMAEMASEVSSSVEPAAVPVSGPASGPAPVPVEASQPVGLGMSEPARKLVEAMRTFREHVEKTADYVGPRFADEARSIHSGEVGDRPIYGEASRDEVAALNEEGIDVMPLPVLPEDKN